MRAVFEDVHDQFAVVGVGKAQQVAAIGLLLAFLLRVPLLLRDPAGALGGEAQARPAHGAAGEDAVAGAEGGVEFGVADVACRSVQWLDPMNGVEGKIAQALAQVAPGVQVPVAPVMQQAQGPEQMLAGVVEKKGVRW